MKILTLLTVSAFVSAPFFELGAQQYNCSKMQAVHGANHTPTLLRYMALCVSIVLEFYNPNDQHRHWIGYLIPYYDRRCAVLLHRLCSQLSGFSPANTTFDFAIRFKLDLGANN